MCERSRELTALLCKLDVKKALRKSNLLNTAAPLSSRKSSLGLGSGKRSGTTYRFSGDRSVVMRKPPWGFLTVTM